MSSTKVKKSGNGQLTEDKYQALWSDRTRDPARVTISLSESTEYAATKVSASVTLSCDQVESSINTAGELAFYKAKELADDCWKELTRLREQEALG